MRSRQRGSRRRSVTSSPLVQVDRLARWPRRDGEAAQVFTIAAVRAAPRAMMPASSSASRSAPRVCGGALAAACWRRRVSVRDAVRDEAHGVVDLVRDGRRPGGRARPSSRSGRAGSRRPRRGRHHRVYAGRALPRRGDAEAVRAALTTLGAEVLRWATPPARRAGGILTAGAKRTGLFYTAGTPSSCAPSPSRRRSRSRTHARTRHWLC